MLDNTLTYTNQTFYNEETGDLLPAASYVIRRHEESANRTTYVDDTTHSVAQRDQVQFYRTFPKRSGSSRGSAKVSFKLTRDVTVPNASGDGEIVLPLIGECSFSLPVGTNQYAIDNLRKKIRGILNDSPIAVDDLLHLLEI